MEWVESLCTLWKETTLIMDETKGENEIDFLGGVMESPAQPEPASG